MLKNIEINPQFKKALGLMEKSDSNIFITGKAGTGKGETYFAEMLGDKFRREVGH